MALVRLLRGSNLVFRNGLRRMNWCFLVVLVCYLEVDGTNAVS